MALACTYFKRAKPCELPVLFTHPIMLGPFFVAYQTQGVAVSCLFFTLDHSAFGILIT